MRKRILGCLFGLLAAAPLALGQTPAPQTITLPASGMPTTSMPTTSMPTSGMPVSGIPVGGDHFWNAPVAMDGVDGGGCGPFGRVWVDAAYLLWWFRGASTPPLVTTSPFVPFTANGAVGQPGTTVLYGGNNIGQNPHSGMWLTAGFWLDDNKTVGVEGNYFWFFPGSQTTTFASDGTAVLARPFLNVLGFPIATGGENSELLAAPGVSGAISIGHNSTFQGAGLSSLFNICCCCGSRLDLVTGFSFLQLSERLSITESSLIPPGAGAGPLDGTMPIINDQFSTTNRFYGGTLGFRGEVWNDWAFARLTGTVGLGETNQQVNINGSTQLYPLAGGAPFIAPGGLLALPSNMGNYSRNGFSVVPMIDFKAGLCLGNNLRIFAGYNWLFWSSIARPGDQIDRAINPVLVPSFVFPGTVSLPPVVGSARPVAVINDKNFWAQGINLGVELRF